MKDWFLVILSVIKPSDLLNVDKIIVQTSQDRQPKLNLAEHQQVSNTIRVFLSPKI